MRCGERDISGKRESSVDPATHVRRGLASAARGDTQGAVEHYRAAIGLDPHCGNAHYTLSLLPGSFGDDDIERMRETCASEAVSTRDRMLNCFALGKALDRLGRFDEAFGFTRRANTLQRASSPYAIDEQAAFFARHADHLGSGLQERCRPHASRDPTPILIAGLPRSGTTLVEQVLAAHPSVYGAGEVECSRVVVEAVRKLTGRSFPQEISDVAPGVLCEIGREYVRCLRALQPDSKHITDKLPHNFLRVGFFTAVLSRARIIECRRDALDNCLSIYQHHFADEHGYSSDLVDLGSYHRLYERIMQHWKEAAPGRLHTVDYERLVDDPEREIRAMLDYCGLPFDPACMKSHEQDRAIGTPSAALVRMPIYRDAVGRWRNYERQLQPLIAALQEDDGD